MPPTVHHLQVSQSERIVWLCEELAIPYTLKTYTRSPLWSPPPLASLTPQKSAPVLTDTHHGREFTISESGAIAEYLINVHGDGRLTLSPAHKDYPEYLFWLHFANGTLQPTSGRKMIARLANPALDSSIVAAADANIAKCLGAVEARLNQTNAWLAGDEFTAADVMSVWCLTTMRNFVPTDLSGYPAILAYLQRVGRREAYRTAMARGDPELEWERGLTAEGYDRFGALADVERQLGVGRIKVKAKA